MPADVPRMEVRPPTILTSKAIVATSLYGLILLVPVLLSMMWVSTIQFGVASFLIPLIAIALATFFLPLGFGNPYVARLVHPLKPAESGECDIYIVQLTRNPRNRSGLMAILEDADDIGFLNFTHSSLIFCGDSVRLTVPYDQIKDLTVR